MKWLWSLFLLFFVLPDVLGQSTEMRFSDSTVSVEHGATFKNSLVIQNLEDHPIVVERVDSNKMLPGVLLDVPLIIKLEANEQRVLPLKYMANEELIRSSEQISYQFQIRSSQGKRTQEVTFKLDIVDDWSVWIVHGQETIYLNPDGAQEFDFIIENGSFQSRNIAIDVNASPNGLQISGYEPALELKAKERRWVKMRISQRRRSNTFSRSYRITIYIKDQQTGENIASSRLTASTLSNSHQLLSSRIPNISGNFAELTYNQTGRHYQYTQLRGGAEFPIGQSLVSVASTLEYYDAQNAYNIYDTWLDIQGEKLGLRVGNLHGGNVDFNLSGRGAQLRYQLNDHSSIEVVGVENNYQLYSNLYDPFEVGRTIAATYHVDNDFLKNSRFSALYSEDPNMGVKTKMASFEAGFITDSTDNLRVVGGLSHEQWRGHEDAEIGFSVGVNYVSDFLGWRILSDNFYSTPNYGGNRRGNFYLNERFSRELNERHSIYIAYVNSRNNPQYFGYQMPLRNQYNEDPTAAYYDQIGSLADSYPFFVREFFNHEQSLAAGFTSRKKGFIYSIEPKVEAQHRQSMSVYRMFSYRLGLNASMVLNSHNLSFNTVLSLSEDKGSEKWFTGFKGNVAYHWKGLGLNAMYQVNPYYVSDLERLKEGQNYWTLAFRPNYIFTLWDETIKGRISVSTDYVSTYAMWMQYAEARMDYKITDTWDLTADVRITRLDQRDYAYNSLNNTQFRIGIRKRFTRRTALGNHKVQLNFYDDINGNRQLDADELLVDGVIVKLDEHVSITDDKGKARYLNVPKDDYRLSLAANEEWRIAQDNKLEVNKNLNLDVPLIKVVSIRGSLTEKRVHYDRFPADVQGIKVYARNEAGLVSSTLTDEDGNFRFNLAPGDYTFYIRNNRYEFLNPSQQMTVGDTSVNDAISFEFQKKNTDIKIQKF